jgi:predicted nucleic acid-binding protein
MKKVYVDSDVIIAALLSNQGVSYDFLFSKGSIKYISDSSYKELVTVVERKGLSKTALDEIVASSLTVVKDIQDTLSLDNTYVMDLYDTHIINGAIACKVQFLVTYNIRHFYAEKIKQTFDIIVLRPGNYLQYLRSIS